MVDLTQWAIRNHVSFAALEELRQMMGQGYESPQPALPNESDFSEAAVSSRVELEAPSKGVILWRNNVGALLDANGTPVRYGLANVSAKMNKKVKSSDFVGLRKRVVMPSMLGHTIGQFVAREMKEAGWRYNMNDPHEAAQAQFINIVNSFGGDAAFCTGVGSF